MIVSNLNLLRATGSTSGFFRIRRAPRSRMPDRLAVTVVARGAGRAAAAGAEATKNCQRVCAIPVCTRDVQQGEVSARQGGQPDWRRRRLIGRVVVVGQLEPGRAGAGAGDQVLQGEQRADQQVPQARLEGCVCVRFLSLSIHSKNSVLIRFIVCAALGRRVQGDCIRRPDWLCGHGRGWLLDQARLHPNQSIVLGVIKDNCVHIVFRFWRGGITNGACVCVVF